VYCTCSGILFHGRPDQFPKLGRCTCYVFSLFLLHAKYAKSFGACNFLLAHARLYMCVCLHIMIIVGTSARNRVRSRVINLDTNYAKGVLSCHGQKPPFPSQIPPRDASFILANVLAVLPPLLNCKTPL